MTFVYSHWYIVMAVLLIAIVALIVTFVLMDKKDKVLIDEFVKSMQTEPVAEKSEQPAEDVANEQSNE